MRLENFDPSRYDEYFETVTMDRMYESSYVVKDKAVQFLRGYIGSGKTTGISRPMYKKGPYKDQPWTARDFGQLLESIRVVRKTGKSGKPLTKKMDVRIYAGHYLAYYARIFEFDKSFMRKALNYSIPEIRTIMGI